MPRSALIVAVPEAEPLVHEWRLRYDNAELGIPAHVTLIFPFVPAEEIGEELVAELRELFAARAGLLVHPDARRAILRTSPGSRPTPPIPFAG